MASLLPIEYLDEAGGDVQLEGASSLQVVADQDLDDYPVDRIGEVGGVAGHDELAPRDILLSLGVSVEQVGSGDDLSAGRVDQVKGTVPTMLGWSE